MESTDSSTDEQRTNSPPDLEAVEGNRKRRVEWEENHALILIAIIELRGVHGRFPMLAELKAHTKLSIATLERHVAEFKSTQDRFEKFRELTDNVIWSMYDGCVENRDARSQKLWMQVVEGWEEKKRITQVNQNPYANLSEEDLRKKAEERRAKLALRQKAMDAAREV